MSDYGDDYSDYEEDWFYVEEEYIVADDLAEHAVQSPPPSAYPDEDTLPDWDRFDYFNDLEYASDGYDNATFETHKNGTGVWKTGTKRKRGVTADYGKKKQRAADGHGVVKTNLPNLTNSPVVWRSQTDRGAKPKLLDDNAESYALLKDWREKLEVAPHWGQKSPHPASPAQPSSSKAGKAKAVYISEPISPTSESDAEDDDAGEIDPAALMAALQNRLAAAGGPLSGMDPQQLLQFAMRMATDKDAGDDIAGEMADEMLNQGEDDEEEEGEASVLSWVAQQRNANHGSLLNGESSGVAPTPKSPDVSRGSRPPPTPPSSESTRSVRVADESMDDIEPTAKNDAAFKHNGSLKARGEASRKRKADDAEGSSANASKKRATRSYEAPTAASQAKAAPSKPTRSGRVNR